MASGHEAGGGQKKPTIKNPANSEYMRNHPNRDVILAHAAKTGAPVPVGDHFMRDGEDGPLTSLIDDKGIRHIYRSKDTDSRTDSQTNSYYRRVLGYDIQEDEYSEGYEMTIPQEGYLRNQQRFIEKAKARSVAPKPGRSGGIEGPEAASFNELAAATRVPVGELLQEA
jgi:hypothetical protein